MSVRFACLKCHLLVIIYCTFFPETHKILPDSRITNTPGVDLLKVTATVEIRQEVYHLMEKTGERSLLYMSGVNR